MVLSILTPIVVKVMALLHWKRTNSPTITYLWSTGDTSPSVTGLNAGRYTVTITDAQTAVLKCLISL